MGRISDKQHIQKIGSGLVTQMEVAVLVIVNMTYDNAERSMTPSFSAGTLVFGAGNAGTATQI